MILLRTHGGTANSGGRGTRSSDRALRLLGADRPAVKVVIPGGRNYVMTTSDYIFLENVFGILGASAILPRGARGVEAQAAAWAIWRNLPVATIRPNWKNKGDAAPFQANAWLAEAAKAVIDFAGAEDTADMVDQARRIGLPLHESPGRPLANLPTMDTRLRYLWPENRLAP